MNRSSPFFFCFTVFSRLNNNTDLIFSFAFLIFKHEHNSFFWFSNTFLVSRSSHSLTHSPRCLSQRRRDDSTHDRCLEEADNRHHAVDAAQRNHLSNADDMLSRPFRAAVDASSPET